MRKHRAHGESESICGFTSLEADLPRSAESRGSLKLSDARTEKRKNVERESSSSSSNAADNLDVPKLDRRVDSGGDAG